MTGALKTATANERELDLEAMTMLALARRVKAHAGKAGGRAVGAGGVRVGEGLEW